jgi:sugar O-acyltransferase (sialic acid O-acetyltransferase NeuD family)
MSKPNIILIGAGGHARSCIDVVEQQGHFQIAGLIGTQDQVGAQSMHYGYDVIGIDADLSRLSNIYQFALVTLGQIESARIRMQLYVQSTQLGYVLPTIIAPTAHVSSHARIGAGSIVMHGAIVNAGASIGNNCIINSRSLIEHDAKIDDHCHVSTGAIINGDVTVGAGSFVGSGSVIKQGVAIGNGCLVGMGLSVRDDIPDQVDYRGR